VPDRSKYLGLFNPYSVCVGSSRLNDGAWLGKKGDIAKMPRPTYDKSGKNVIDSTQCTQW